MRGDWLLVGRRAQKNILSDFAVRVLELPGQGVGIKRSRRRFAPAYAKTMWC
jgi:hypothetical protein